MGSLQHHSGGDWALVFPDLQVHRRPVQEGHAPDVGQVLLDHLRGVFQVSAVRSLRCCGSVGQSMWFSVWIRWLFIYLLRGCAFLFGFVVCLYNIIRCLFIQYTIYLYNKIQRIFFLDLLSIFIFSERMCFLALLSIYIFIQMMCFYLIYYLFVHSSIHLLVWLSMFMYAFLYNPLFENPFTFPITHWKTTHLSTAKT